MPFVIGFSNKFHLDSYRKKVKHKKSSKTIHIKETQIFKFDSSLFYSRLRVSTHICVWFSLQANISQIMGSITPGCIYRMLPKFACLYSFGIIDIFLLNIGPAEREVKIFIWMSRVPLSSQRLQKNTVIKQPCCIWSKFLF